MGVHYPLDVIGSRMTAERNVAHYLNDPKYHALFGEARDELRAALEKECGEKLVDCAKPGDTKSDPWAAPDQRIFYRFTMTYNLHQIGKKDAAIQVPDAVDLLLGTLRPDISAAGRKAILGRMARVSGYPLDSQDSKTGFWQRVDLYDAALEAERRWVATSLKADVKNAPTSGAFLFCGPTMLPFADTHQFTADKLWFALHTDLKN